MTTRRTIRLALVAGLVIAAAACGGDDDADSGGDGTSAPAATDAGGTPAASEPAATEPAATEPATEPAGTEPDGTATEGTEAGSGQQVAGTSGDICTYDIYGGDGVEQVDPASATIGFAQSEREANPFRIAETQSIRDEAEARGIELIVTNAESDLNKEISDIQGMVDQGVDALIISPLNSEGLDPAIDYANENGIPIMTIDRRLTTMTACEDFIGWVGSDFVEQGRRAADAMVRETGGRASWPSCSVHRA